MSATALAATCVMESNCQNVGASGGGSASGAFQMINSTYTADINGAVAYDPAISGSIVSGLAGQMDPTTEAYAASYELRTDALALQGDGIADPTVLQTRAVYQFGGNVGPDVAAANDSDNIAQITGLSAASLGPVATCVGIDWRIFGRHEAIRSCGEVNDLIVWFLGEGLPSVDLAHGDLS